MQRIVHPRYYTFKSILFQLSMILLTIFSGNSLHIHNQQKTLETNVYNKNIYYSQLKGIQGRFSNDLKNIKDKFTKINLQLSTTNVSLSSRFITLQQNLAQQRDALYNVQKYLSLPFALKSCQCINFTDTQKNNMKSQIANITQAINGLVKNLKVDNNGKFYQNYKCPEGNCPTAKQISSQIDKMRQYARIMTDTVTAQCCKRITYLFRDNVAGSSQWIYGNLTEQQYRLQLFKMGDKKNITSCPINTPFANIQINQCYACPKDKPIFNLQLRKCVEPCSQNNSIILNTTTHSCSYNTTCQNGYYWNSNNNTCTLDLGTDSRCPQLRPIWNQKSLSCQRCPENKPFFDLVVSACRACTINQIWYAQTLSCTNKNALGKEGCTSGQIFNIDTLKCE